MTDRRKFITYFINHISKLRYVLLKYTSNSISELSDSSDIDLLIDQKHLYRVLEIVRAGANISSISMQQKSFVTFVSIHFEDQSYLELDLIHRFDRKGFIYLDAEEVFKDHAANNEGVKIPSPEHHFEYIMLFYMLNNSDVPAKYVQHIASYTMELRNRIFGYVRPKYDLILNNLDELMVFNRVLKGKLRAKIKKEKFNRGFAAVASRFRYAGDAWNDLINNHGHIITFSGVDGAGKSTILENIKKILEVKYRQKIVVIRHRPSVFPILSALIYGKEKAEEKAMSRLPRTGKNKNIFSSSARFVYYYLDYLLGQFFVYFRYTLRGYTVLYDRYYFDFIIDAKRSNISLNKNFIRMGYSFVFKPEVNVFLYAEPEIILQRKKEMSSEDIQELNRQYIDLFNDLEKKSRRRKYISINNTDKEKTLDIVLKEFFKVTS